VGKNGRGGEEPWDGCCCEDGGAWLGREERPRINVSIVGELAWIVRRGAETLSRGGVMSRERA